MENQVEVRAKIGLEMISSNYSAATDRPVGFLDSGIGGLPYLARARELLPSERFVYYADHENFPYGERAVADVRRIVQTAVSELVAREQPKLVCVACNTASVVSLDSLRSTFNIPFVGVVPAIKPAGMLSGGGRIAVLATARTVDDPYVANLIKEFAAESSVELVAAGKLVDAIENGLSTLDRQHLRALLAKPVEELRRSEVDVVVLGCTHFVHIRDELQSMLGDSMRVVDSVEGVARQVARVCDNVGRCSAKSGSDLIIVSDGVNANYRALAERFGLVLQTGNRVR